MKNKTLSKNDPYYLKIGKFKKKSVYDAKVDMSDQMENTFESLGREHITKEQYINIGFNYALIKGLGEVKSKKK
jgi:hypothetical protein